MQGLGKNQEKIREKNLDRIFKVIFQANSQERFGTIGEINAITGLSIPRIRIHLKSLLDSDDIIEEPTYNNTRGFVIPSIHTWNLKHSYVTFELNTKKYINKLKFPQGKKLKLDKKTERMIRKLHHLD